MIKLITTASDITKTEMLQKSLKNHGWDYEILVHPWRGFGDKIIKTYEYLKDHPEITHFFYSDSYDTVVVNTMEEALKKVEMDCILLSAEMACYPHPDKELLYPKHKSPWRFVNGGGWFCDASVFILAVESNPIRFDDVDQVWFTDLFLNHPEYVKLDYFCNVFQTIAFVPDDAFSIVTTQFLGNRDLPDICGSKEFYIKNNLHSTIPTFWHGNGHTCMDKFYKLI